MMPLRRVNRKSHTAAEILLAAQRPHTRIVRL
jgi:hypothetical protein